MVKNKADDEKENCEIKKMVYVNTTISKINKYVGKELTVEQIEETLVDMGMDLKGETILDNGDKELKVEITAEKMDMVSAVGIARAIKYYRGLETKLPQYNIEKGTNKVIVDKSVSKVRPRTACVILRDINMTQELLDEMIEIQEKIHDSFGRNRRKASIGIYPCDDFEFPVSFKAQKPEEIIFRPLEADEEMDGNKILVNHDTGKKFAHILEAEELFPVFRDANGKVLSMVPIINSHDTGRVDLHHKDLFVELSGHNLTYLDSLLKVMITTFIEMGAKAETVIIEYPNEENYELNLDNFEDTVSLDYINKLIGVDFTKEDIKKLGPKVMFNVKEIKGEDITFEIPCYRSDIWHDSDIADDIARAYGYNNIELSFPKISTIGSNLEESDFREQISNSLVSLGFNELYTYMLTSTNIQFKKMNLETPDKKFIKLVDSEDQGINMTRVRVLPEILQSLHINRKNKYPQKVFENGFTIQEDSTVDTGAINQLNCAVAIADPKSNYTQIKEALDSLMMLNEIKFEIKGNDEISFLIPGRSAEILVNGKSCGYIGEVHPQVLENFGIIVPVSVFELIVDDLNF